MSSCEVMKTIAMGKDARLEVIIDHSKPEDSVERVTIQNVCEHRPGSWVFHVPPHWHKNHSEYITVLEGRAEITLDGKSRIVHAGDPTLYIPARHTHSMKGFEGERLVLTERAEPAGLYKAEFFNDILSTGSFPGFWHFMRAYHDGDTYAALPGNLGIVDEAFTFIFGGIARFIAPAKISL